MKNLNLVEIPVLGEQSLLVPVEVRRIFDNFEPLSVSFVKKILKGGDVFVDVGANFGFYSVLAGALTGDFGKVISVEPSPETLDILRKNVSHLSNVFISPFAISSSSGKIDFYHTEDYVNSGSVENPPFIGKDRVKKISVESRSLDDILENDYKLDRIDFIKIDVQGNDVDVLLSCDGVLSRSDGVKVLVEWAPTWMINAGYSPFELPETLKNLGFRNIFCIDDWTNSEMSVEEFYRIYEKDESGKRFCNIFAEK